jgi:hypothetical protein
MAEHRVNLEIPGKIEVGHADFKFRIYRGGQRFGTLTISKGTIDWKPRNAKRGKPGETQKTWDEFDRVMKDNNPHKK